MTNKEHPSFLNWQKRFQKPQKEERKEFYEEHSFDSFFKITPAWKSGKNYALIQIRPREFKLFEKKNPYIKGLIKCLSQIFLYVNPEDYNNEMQDILNYGYENKHNFKNKMDRRLEVY